MTPAPPPRFADDPSPLPYERTLRFDEFVQVVDAAGFGPGQRSPLHRDIARAVAWSAVGVVTAGVVGSIVWTLIAR